MITKIRCGSAFCRKLAKYFTCSIDKSCDCNFHTLYLSQTLQTSRQEISQSLLLHRQHFFIVLLVSMVEDRVKHRPGRLLSINPDDHTHGKSKHCEENRHCQTKRLWQSFKASERH